MDTRDATVGLSPPLHRVAILVFGALLACLVSRVARADDRRDSEALYQQAEKEDQALDFKNALAHYEASSQRLPSSRTTPRANRRAAELRTHSEGDFAPFVRLETVRRSPRLADDPVVIDALVKDAAGFPPGKVRVEARMLAAEAYAGRLGRKDDALPLLRLVMLDPNAEVLTAREAATELVAAYVARNDFASALDIADAHGNLLQPTAARDIRRLMRRGPLRVLAGADLAALLVLALIALAGNHRRLALRAAGGVTPMAILFAATATLVGGFLASRYEQASPYPFTKMLAWMVGVIVVARIGSGGGSPKLPARVFRAVLAFAGVFAAAFLLLDKMDPVYLAGFGL